jgi:hypothetical protein
VGHWQTDDVVSVSVVTAAVAAGGGDTDRSHLGFCGRANLWWRGGYAVVTTTVTGWRKRRPRGGGGDGGGGGGGDGGGAGIEADGDGDGGGGGVAVAARRDCAMVK